MRGIIIWACIARVSSFKTASSLFIELGRKITTTTSINGHSPKIPAEGFADKQVALEKLISQYKNSSEGKRVFDEALTFPVKFQIKVIGINDQTFAVDMVSILGSIVGTKPEDINVTVRETSGGKYISVSALPVFNSADELYSAYEAISKDSRVKFLL
eukprot:gene617-1191_t